MFDRPGKGLRRVKFSAAAASLLFFALLAGCRTAPPPLPPVHPSAALPAGADLYFTLSVPENRDFLRRVTRENGLRSRGTDYFIDRSAFIFGSASAGPDGGLLVTMAADGDYSGSLVEFGIRREEGWEEIVLALPRGKIRYYRSADGGTEISVPSDRLILFTMGGRVEESLRALYDPVPSAAPDLPPGFEARAAAFRLPRPGEKLSNSLGGLGITSPLRRADLFADRGKASYIVSGSFSFEGEREARTSSVLLRLLLSSLLAAQGRSFQEIRGALTVETSGPALNFGGAEFSDDSIAAFLRSRLPADRFEGKK